MKDEEEDPGRDLLTAAVEAGLMSPSLAAELDAWADNLAREMREQELTREEVEARIMARLEADLRRRGQA